MDASIVRVLEERAVLVQEERSKAISERGDDLLLHLCPETRMKFSTRSSTSGSSGMGLDAKTGQRFNVSVSCASKMSGVSARGADPRGRENPIGRSYADSRCDPHMSFLILMGC